MNSIMNKGIVVGLLLGAVCAYSDVVVDDFTGGTVNDLLPKGGSWSADADYYSGGSSKVNPLADTSDLVKGTAYSGDNTLLAYPGDGTISSRLTVSKDVSPTKPWAYAGWVLDILAGYAKPGDTTKVYNLDIWNRNNEVNVSTCAALSLTAQFDAGKQLRVVLFEPAIAKNALAPQYGWRYAASGTMETKVFSLTGLGKPAPAFTDPANTLPLDLTKVNRIEIFYEGQVGTTVAITAPYDAGAVTPHVLKIKNVTFTGAGCAVTPNPGASNSAIFGQGPGNRDFSVGSVNGQLRFSTPVQTGTLDIVVRNIQGKVMARGNVDAQHASLDVSQLNNGIYTVQASNSKFNRFATVTLLK
jgi:hypothetical protein